MVSTSRIPGDQRFRFSSAWAPIGQGPCAPCDAAWAAWPGALLTGWGVEVAGRMAGDDGWACGMLPHQIGEVDNDREHRSIRLGNSPRGRDRSRAVCVFKACDANDCLVDCTVEVVTSRHWRLRRRHRSNRAGHDLSSRWSGTSSLLAPGANRRPSPRPLRAHDRARWVGTHHRTDPASPPCPLHGRRAPHRCTLTHRRCVLVRSRGLRRGAYSERLRGRL